MKRLIIVSATLLNCASLSAYSASDERISPIQKAAMERLKGKLGDMRGTINLKDRHVFLTNQMIDHLRPVDPDNPAAEQDLPTEIDPAPTQTIIVEKSYQPDNTNYDPPASNVSDDDEMARLLEVANAVSQSISGQP